MRNTLLAGILLANAVFAFGAAVINTGDDAGWLPFPEIGDEDEEEEES